VKGGGGGGGGGKGEVTIQGEWGGGCWWGGGGGGGGGGGEPNQKKKKSRRDSSYQTHLGRGESLSHMGRHRAQWSSKSVKETWSKGDPFLVSPLGLDSCKTEGRSSGGKTNRGGNAVGGGAVGTVARELWLKKAGRLTFLPIKKRAPQGRTGQKTYKSIKEGG